MSEQPPRRLPPPRILLACALLLGIFVTYCGQIEEWNRFFAIATGTDPHLMLHPSTLRTAALLAGLMGLLWFGRPRPRRVGLAVGGAVLLYFGAHAFLVELRRLQIGGAMGFFRKAEATLQVAFAVLAEYSLLTDWRARGRGSPATSGQPTSRRLPPRLILLACALLLGILVAYCGQIAWWDQHYTNAGRPSPHGMLEPTALWTSSVLAGFMGLLWFGPPRVRRLGLAVGGAVLLLHGAHAVLMDSNQLRVGGALGFFRASEAALEIAFGALAGYSLRTGRRARG